MKKSKNNKTSPEVNSEKIRNKDTDNGTFTFKKVLYGYDPEEVASYINELSETAEASAKNYELKLSAIKEELVLSNRERDSYAEKYRKSKTVQKPSETKKTEEKSDYEGVIAEYKSKLEKAVAENALLAEKLADKGQNEEKEKIIKALEAENGGLRKTADTLKGENSVLSAKAEKYDGLFEQYGALLSQLELLKAENESKTVRLAEKETELAGKLDEFKTVQGEYEESKKKYAEYEAEKTVLECRNSELEKENAKLKETGEAQAKEYAEKITLLENECAAGRLEMQKEQKLRAYHISQAENAVAELSRQLEQIKEMK
ncbi:MAG: hypothetical protein IKU08_07595 [Clostridia bacterium]|nr:hypothetical protein [Clostridia bacterium]